MGQKEFNATWYIQSFVFGKQSFLVLIAVERPKGL